MDNQLFSVLESLFYMLCFINNSIQQGILMLSKKLLLFALALQISTATIPQTSQHDSINTDHKNKPAKQAQHEIDPGLSLLLSCVGASLGGFITFLGVVSTGGTIVVCHENYPYSSNGKAIAWVLGLTGLTAGLGVTYIGAKMTWFYLKRGGKTLFHKKQPQDWNNCSRHFVI